MREGTIYNIKRLRFLMGLLSNNTQNAQEQQNLKINWSKCCKQQKLEQYNAFRRMIILSKSSMGMRSALKNEQYVVPKIKYIHKRLLG